MSGGESSQEPGEGGDHPLPDDALDLARAERLFHAPESMSKADRDWLLDEDDPYEEGDVDSYYEGYDPYEHG